MESAQFPLYGSSTRKSKPIVSKEGNVEWKEVQVHPQQEMEEVIFDDDNDNKEAEDGDYVDGHISLEQQVIAEHHHPVVDNSNDHHDHQENCYK